MKNSSTNRILIIPVQRWVKQLVLYFYWSDFFIFSPLGDRQQAENTPSCHHAPKYQDIQLQFTSVKSSCLWTHKWMLVMALDGTCYMILA